jgi:tetratricopeptide (TPR) repeat protein
MDAGTVWTIIGSIAGVLAVGVGILQLRQGRQHSGLPAPANAASDVSIDAILPPPIGHMPPLVRGRDDLVEELATAAVEPDSKVHVLTGLGGCGKSTVALALARRCREAGQLVWWLPTVDRASVTSRLLGLAQLLGAPDGEVREALAGRISPSDVLWRRLETVHGWVLILDNADDPSVLATAEHSASAGAGWLRSTGAGLVLVTSRTTNARAWGPLATVHSVANLGVDDSAQVLCDLAPDAGDIVHARKLAVRLAGLPLALHQAGAYLSSDFAAERDFDAYGRALDTRFGELLGRGDDDRAQVASTWELSLDALAAHGKPQARELLQVLSCFAAASPVPSLLLDLKLIGQRIGGQAAAEDGLAGLHSLGLIETRSGETGRTRPLVQVHSLVAETVRHRAGETLTDSYCTAVDLLHNAVTRLSAQNLQDQPAWLTLLPHLQALLEREVAVPVAALERLAWSAHVMADALRWGGAYLASFDDVADRALQRITMLGADHEQTLALRFSRAHANSMLGRWTEAEAEFRDILIVRSRTLGPEHPDTLSTRHMIADVLVYLGKPADAASEFGKILTARRKVLGPDHPDTLDTWHDAAWVLAVQGRNAEAEAELRQILAIQLRVLGPEHRDTLHIRHHIANALAAQGKPAEAEAEFRQILAIQIQVLGSDHPDTHTSLQGIGDALAAQGRAAEAEAEFRQALETRLRVLGPSHPDTLTTRHNLGCALRDQGKAAEATAELQQVLSARTQTLGPEHPDSQRTAQAMEQAPSRLRAGLLRGRFAS